MPMCDVYLPHGALPEAAEQRLMERVTEILVDHEMRRVTDLSSDPEKVAASRQNALAVAWLFVNHVDDIYVAGTKHGAPHYKFVCSVPEGQSDEEFREAVIRDITKAVAEAENGVWPSPKSRVWIFPTEIPEGTWGAFGRPSRLKDVIKWVAPELTDFADDRLAERRQQTARAILAAAETVPSV